MGLVPVCNIFRNPNAWALLGHCHYLLENLAKAKDCYERVVEYVKHPVHVNIVT